MSLIKNFSRALAALAISAAAAAPAFAQQSYPVTLENVKGNVMVNNGYGFRPYDPRMPLQPGFRVLVQPGGSVDVVQSGRGSDCRVSLQSGVVFYVPNGTIACKVTQGPTDTATIIGATTTAVVAAVAINQDQKKKPSSP
jgi:hypothetical protein